MSSRPYVVHRVSATEPVGQQVGDEWFNPATNVLTKALAVNGNVVTAAQVPVTVGNVTAISALSVTGTVTAGNIQTLGSVTAGSVSSVNTFGFKNRIINGGMVIDQRNAGASVNISTATNTYTLDRWRANASGGGVFSVQRSTTAPAGFVNSLLATVVTADASIAGGDFYHIRQSIEGLNFYDLNFGTAAAKDVAVSFWVRSSVPGTYSVLLRNEAGNRGYLSSYTINSPNTFEYKTVVIPGDTSGTWATDNTSAAILSFNIGAGATQTTNTWLTTVNEGVTGLTQWISNLGATFFISGVQLEYGSAPTSFDFRSIGTELFLCMRYCQRFNVFPVSGFDNFTSYFGGSNAVATDKRLSVPMRSTPIAVFTNAGVEYYSFAGAWTATTLQISIGSNEMYYIFIASDGDGRGKLLRNGGAGANPQPTVTFTSEL